MTILYWPYDEVTLQMGQTESEIIVDTPWLTTTLTIQPDQISRAQKLIEKFQHKKIGGEDLSEINWFFKSLSDYPLCYILPGKLSLEEKSQHALLDAGYLSLPPARFLLKAILNPEHQQDAQHVSQKKLFEGDWKWDAAGALQFATTPEGIDPRALFSVARRYHLLSAISDNQTDSLYELVSSFKEEKEKSLKASALMVRQNHYVTERCLQALIPALQTAQSARSTVEHFIKEETGHDKILYAALKSMVDDPHSIPVMSESKLLMDMLKLAAERNFLGFAMAVDAFERSSYEEIDPLAKVLSEGGFKKASHQIDRHKDINDSGGHENLALSFVNTISYVDQDFALEALRIAELVANLMNLISTSVQGFVQETKISL